MPRVARAALERRLQRFSRRVNWVGGGFYELTRVTLALQYSAVNSKSKPNHVNKLIIRMVPQRIGVRACAFLREWK